MKKKRIGILVVIGLWIALMVYPVNFRVVQAAPGDTTLVSVSTSGSVGNGGSINPSLSADGRYVAFESSAPDLVLGDTNGKWDIFVRDRQTGTTKLVSTGFGLLGPANGNSFNSAISADGRYVAFESIASNLVPGDTNNKRDIFVRDLQTNTTGRVSVSTGGSQANDHSYNPAISADGRYVAFWSDASNLVPNDTNGVSDIFVHDRQTGETRRVSVSSTGVQANMVSYFPSISADGRYVAYNSIASNLVSGDSNGEFDVFVHDLTNGQTQRVSVSSNGTQGNGSSLQPKISGNGHFVAFPSYATNLVNNDTNGHSDIFIRDLQTGTTERVSVDSFGGQAFGESLDASLSNDGRFVTFASDASNLVANDTNFNRDIFVHDRQTHKTHRVSVRSDGVQANFTSLASSISGDGKVVGFDSTATNLVNNDTNDRYDVFVHETTFTLETLSILYAAPSAVGAGNCSNWANACTLQTALGAANSGQQIWVKQGVHKPTTNTSERTATFTLKNGVTILGGFAGTESSLSERNPKVNLTILSGDIDNNDTNTDGNSIAEMHTHLQGNNSYHVVTSPPNVTAVLDGFIITAGRPNFLFDINGGGLLSTQSSPVIRNVVFSGNYAQNVGGGAYVSEGSPLFLRVSFVGNATQNGDGGGLYLNTSNVSQTVTLYQVTFEGNRALSAAGGGIANSGNGTVELFNVTFSGNIANTKGGGMYNGIGANNTVLRFVTLNGNTATTSGGGLMNENSNPTVIGSILWGNTPTDLSNQSATPNISYSIIGGCGSSGSLWVSSCGTDQGNNLAQNPLLKTLADNGGFVKTIGLQNGSPAINSGGSTCPQYDGRGVERPQGAACDRGAYEVEVGMVESIRRDGASPTDESGVSFTVLFTTAVSGVDVNDFSLFTSGGLSGVSVVSVSGAGRIYNVVVNTGSGSGELRLDIPATATITDSENNPLSGLPYTAGESYTIERLGAGQNNLFLPLILRSP